MQPAELLKFYEYLKVHFSSVGSVVLAQRGEEESSTHESFQAFVEKKGKIDDKLNWSFGAEFI